MANKTRVQKAIEAYDGSDKEAYAATLAEYKEHEVAEILEALFPAEPADKPTPEPTNRVSASKVKDTDIVYIHNKQNGAVNAISGKQAKKLARQADMYEIVDNPNKK